jgi:hypothetical protein
VRRAKSPAGYPISGGYSNGTSKYGKCPPARPRSA